LVSASKGSSAVEPLFPTDVAELVLAAAGHVVAAPASFDPEFTFWALTTLLIFEIVVEVFTLFFD